MHIFQEYINSSLELFVNNKVH